METAEQKPEIKQASQQMPAGFSFPDVIAAQAALAQNALGLRGIAPAPELGKLAWV